MVALRPIPDPFPSLAPEGHLSLAIGISPRNGSMVRRTHLSDFLSLYEECIVASTLGRPNHTDICPCRKFRFASARNVDIRILDQ